MAFIEKRLNKDNFWNLVFWAAVTLDVYIFLPNSYLMAFLIFIGLVIALKKLSPLTLVAKRGDVITKLVTLEDLNKEVAKEANKELSALDKEKTKELPEVEYALANSEGRIVSEGSPSLFFALFSPVLIGFPLGYIFDDFMNSIDFKIACFIGVAIFFLIPVSIFILYNRPITLLFNSMAWYLQGWRQTNGSFGRSNSEFHNSHNNDRRYSPSYSYLSNNIYHKR